MHERGHNLEPTNSQNGNEDLSNNCKTFPITILLMWIEKEIIRIQIDLEMIKVSK